ncbi:MAG: hypothetical protein WDN04_07280 [Rhodospirillales bacterium]
MRIIHAGNFGTRAKGAALNSIAPKLSRGLVRAGHAVVDFADREVARAATPFGGRALGTGAANRALARLALDVRPDLLLLGHADTIRPATVADLRRAMPAMRVLQWNVDPIFEAGNMARLREKLPVVDATLVSTAGNALVPLKRAGMLLGFLPNPVDFSVETGMAHTRGPAAVRPVLCLRPPEPPHTPPLRRGVGHGGVHRRPDLPRAGFAPTPRGAVRRTAFGGGALSGSVGRVCDGAERQPPQ